MEKRAPGPAAGADGGRGHPVPYRRRRRHRHRRRPAATGSPRSCWPAARGWPRDLPVPGRELAGIYQAMEFLPLANRVTRPAGVAPVSRRRASTWSSSAAATPAPTASAPRTGRARPRSTQLEIMPRPPQARGRASPWPTYPMIYRVSSAHEEGGERVYAASTEEFVGGPDGAGAGAAADRGGLRRRPVRAGARHQVVDPVRPGAAGDGLHRGRSSRACSRTWASRSTPVATWPGPRPTSPRSPASSWRGTWDAGSRLSSGRSPRAAAPLANVDAYLRALDRPALPVAIPPTARPLV